jgi:hypothetical protein
MQYAFVDSNNICQNLIAYDPSLPHGQVVPPTGQTLQEVNDWIQIGQNINASEPQPPSPTPAQQAAYAINAGIVLTSTGTPALNSTYATNAAAQQQLNAIMTYIIVNNAFPGGSTQLPWPDANMTLHTFPSVISFQAFATAIANFVSEVMIYANSNGVIGSIPINTITIP